MTAGGLGIEPKLTASKAAVLPLDDPPINRPIQNTSKMKFFQASQNRQLSLCRFTLLLYWATDSLRRTYDRKGPHAKFLQFEESWCNVGHSFHSDTFQPCQPLLCCVSTQAERDRTWWFWDKTDSCLYNSGRSSSFLAEWSEQGTRSLQRRWWGKYSYPKKDFPWFYPRLFYSNLNRFNTQTTYLSTLEQSPYLK